MATKASRDPEAVSRGDLSTVNRRLAKTFDFSGRTGAVLYDGPIPAIASAKVVQSPAANWPRV